MLAHGSPCVGVPISVATVQALIHPFSVPLLVHCVLDRGAKIVRTFAVSIVRGAQPRAQLYVACPLPARRFTGSGNVALHDFDLARSHSRHYWNMTAVELNKEVAW